MGGIGTSGSCKWPLSPPIQTDLETWIPKANALVVSRSESRPCRVSCMEKSQNLRGEQVRCGDIGVVLLPREDHDMCVRYGPGHGRDGSFVVSRRVAPYQKERRDIES